MVRARALTAEQALRITVFSAVTAKIFVWFIMLGTPDFWQHLLSISDALNRPPSRHPYSITLLPAMPNGSRWVFGLTPGSQKPVSHEQLLILVRGVREDEMSEIVEDGLAVAGGAGDTILGFHFAEWGGGYLCGSMETCG